MFLLNPTCQRWAEKKEAKKTKEIRIMHETFEFMQGWSGGVWVEGCVGVGGG